MTEYPELIEIIQCFAARYTRRTERGPELVVMDEEFRTLAEFLAQGLVEYAEVSRSSDAPDHPALGNFLEEFADRRSRGSDVGASVEVLVRRLDHETAEPPERASCGGADDHAGAGRSRDGHFCWFQQLEG